MKKCKICDRKGLFFKVNSESICEDCLHNISIKENANHKLNSINIEEEIRAVNKYVISFLKNDDLLTICQNFVEANRLIALEFFDLVYVPIIAPAGFDAYGAYAPATEYKFIYPDNVAVENSPYIEILKAYNDGNLYADQPSLLVASAIRKAGINSPFTFNEKGEIYSYISNYLSKEFNKIRELFKTLCNQNVIDTEQDINEYFAFLFLLCTTKKILYASISELYASYKNISVSDHKSIESIIEELYMLGEDSGTILMFLLGLAIKQHFNMPINKIESELTPTIDECIRKLNERRYLDKLRKGESNKPFKYNMAQIDLMNGAQFEDFVAELFNCLGYQTKRTKLSGDQGVDVLANMGDKIIAIQAKHYNQAVGNHAIMEVVAGAKMYNAAICYVVTNNYFTHSAKELANANNVILWDREKLIEKLSEI